MKHIILAISIALLSLSTQAAQPQNMGNLMSQLMAANQKAADVMEVAIATADPASNH